MSKLDSMTYIRALLASRSPGWAMLLSLTILCAHFVTFHSHAVDHRDGTHGQVTATGELEHPHVGVIHLASDRSHDHHAGDLISEFDGYPDCVLNQIAGGILTAALVTIAILLPQPSVRLARFFANPAGSGRFVSHHYLAPPLRAPPR